MYIQEISADIKRSANRNEIWEEFNILMGYYRSNGQTQGKIESQYLTENKLVCLPFTLERDSLDKKFNNFYVTRQIEKLEKQFGLNLTFKTAGKTDENYEGPCKCKKSAFYILITNYVSIGSPLTCGTCNLSVPLYRLPVYYDHGYMPILSWETNYISCDSLQMNCEVGERWALNQMQKVDSQLSRQGVGICKKIEELTSIPTYYYLHNYRKVKGDQLSTPCPTCTQKWSLKKTLHDFYDFKCDGCRLVSTLSFNS